MSGATITPIIQGTPVVSLTGTGVTVNNSGRIDPALLAGMSAQTTGLKISNAAGSTVTVRNLSSGVLKGSTTGLPAGLMGSLDGNAVIIENGAGGSSTLQNSGLIGATALSNSNVPEEDIPVVAMRGGARNTVTNTGTITGRVALQAVPVGGTGNTFTNSGTINGSVNLGAGGLSNSFYASTGSSVNKGNGVALDLPSIISLGLTYAATGFVNGGTLNNGNTLYLQLNPDNSQSNTGSINGSNYVNFNNLVVTGGTWSLTNQLFSASAIGPSVLLSGGLLNVDSAALTGAGITANGGALGAATAGATVASDITLGTNGLTVTTGTNALSLDGMLTGSGALTKTGTGNLTLGGANNFTGGTTLAGGTITLGNIAGLGPQGLNVTGASTLATTGAMTVNNAINLNGANLTVDNVGAVTLSGLINGTGSLTKSTSGGDLTLINANSFASGLFSNGGNLILNGANSIAGGLFVNAGNVTVNAVNDVSGGAFINGGKLTLGNLGDIGAATITAGVGGTGALDTSSARTLTNLVQLNGNLTLTGTSNLTLSGKVSGTGGLNKAGANTLTLSGANDFTGNSTLGGGYLVLQNNTALGSGQLSLTANSGMDVSGLNIGNAINLSTRNLTLNNDTATTLSGALSGTGTLTKTGAGDLTLSGNSAGLANTFQLTSGKLILDSNTALGSSFLRASANTSLDTTAARTIGNSVQVTGNLTIDGSHDLTMNGSILGSGGLTKNGSATLALNGSNNFSGGVQLNAGTLRVDGSLGNGGVAVQSGATLAGGGNVGGAVTIGNGGHLSLASGGVLGLGSLVLNSGSYVDAALGAPVPGATGLANVAGNLTLDGQLNISDAGGFGAGVYRLFDYGGALTDNGLTFGTLGSGVPLSELALQTSVHGQVNLVVGGDSNVRFWDGSQLTGNGIIEGGTGTWNSANANWTTANADLNGAWNNTFAVFQGASGVVTVDGTQSVTGLQFVSDGYTLAGGNSGMLQLVNGTNGTAAVRVDNGKVASLDVSLIGAGTLAKLDAGTLLLNGNNSYTGGTALNGGTLVLGNAGALGSGGLTAANGTTLDNSAALALNNAVTLNGELTLAGSHDLTLNGNVGGNGSLAKNGSSALALNGANTYSGGTLLNGGTLVLGNAGALGSGSLTAANGTTLDSSTALTLNNAVTLAGELTLAGSNDLSLAGVISGAGSLTKQGTSNLTLSGDNTFSGALNILDGSLTLSGDNALGNASLNVSDAAAVGVSGITVLGALSGEGDLSLAAGSELQVGSNNADSVYGGNLNGAGSLSKTGSGKLVLNGQSSITGGTRVNAGSLIIGGASGSTASLASDVQVANGAMLGGHGTLIGRLDVASGATLNPGNSIGMLHVDGDVNLAAGSTLQIEANPDGSSDKLISTGTVTVAGANLQVLAGAGDWAPSTTYGIIQAAALNGTFATVSSNLAFLTPELAYSASGVELTLERNNVSFISAGRTYNQRTIAANIESLGTGTLYNAISVLSAEQAQTAYDSLSGELHASTQGALFDDSRYVRDAIGQRLRAAQGQASTDAILHTDADSGMTFWLQGYGGWGDTSGNSNTASLDHDSRGTLLGIDLPVGDNWRMGMAVGYGSSNLDVDARNSSADIDSTSLTLFAAGQWDAINLRLGASQVWNDIESSRHVQAGSLAEHDKASYDANTTQVFGELGYAIAAGDFTLEPFGGLAHVKVDSDSFKEHGGSSALHGDSEKDEVTYGTLGLHAATALTTLGSVPLALQGTLGWQHAFDDLDPKRQLSFAGGDSFTVKGTPLAQDTALAQLGVTAQVANGTTVGLGYSGQFGDGYKENGIRLGLNVSF
ncbi:autotransporter domain-containing protein [Pseudomonas sp. NY15435]|uniref:autotransporter domain-containing protein n=1 Tax=Pseudomonas sp. NY15435 TaxID=3400358 RepID=UPI003A83DD18